MRASSAHEAKLAVDAVCEGGIPIVEIALTVPGAIEIIHELAKAHSSDVLIGAGTVLDAAAAQRCLDAGAQFIVSPGLDLATIELVHKAGKAVLPGALSPTEIIAAWKADADFVKVFPCGSVGGARYIKALKGPFPQIDFVPTGGVNLQTTPEFIKAGAAAVAVGGELVNLKVLREGKLDVVVTEARKFIEAVRSARASLGQ